VEEMGVPSDYPFDDPTRAMRAIRAIGYDMDYTLIHYDTREWEGRAYEYGLKALAQMGIPTDGLSFDPEMAVRGLVVDSKKGNLLKVDRFGLVKRALHGDQMLSPADVQKVYGRELVHLSNSRWCFLNTLFSVSEGCLFMQVLVSSSSPQLCLLSQCHLHWLVDVQMVAKFDSGDMPVELKITSYEVLWGMVGQAMFRTHVRS
jgi:HAD superfamily 5'-nucleotidase-like hydrolase